MSTTSEEINEAIKALKVAENHLNHCDVDFVESAILEVSSARSKLNALLMRCKGCKGED